MQGYSTASWAVSSSLSLSSFFLSDLQVLSFRCLSYKLSSGLRQYENVYVKQCESVFVKQSVWGEKKGGWARERKGGRTAHSYPLSHILAAQP